MSELDERGFVRVSCDRCDHEQVWLRCEQCAKSDHFLFEGGQVGCACGASYDHAVCLCGAKVGPAGLRFVEWSNGPKSMADLEWNRPRIALLASVALAGVAAIGWWALG